MSRDCFHPMDTCEIENIYLSTDNRSARFWAERLVFKATILLVMFKHEKPLNMYLRTYKELVRGRNARELSYCLNMILVYV